MAKLHAIELAITLATRQRDALAQKHAQAQRNGAFARAQLAQLQGYAQETDARWVAAQASPRSAELVRHHYQFADRLLQAGQMQEGVIANLDRQQAHAHQLLLQAEFKLAGLQQVLKSRQALLRRAQQRNEQRANDEFAALRHLHARAQSASY
jgi:flagellar FliJ protein